MMIKAIIFDCFGVIYPHVSSTFYKEHAQLFKDNPTLVDKLNRQIDLGQISRDQFYNEIASFTNIDRGTIKCALEVRRFPNDQLIKTIETLRSKYKIALLSNAGEEEISVIYEDGIAKLFDVLTISSQVGCVKPDREIFEICLRSLDVDPSEALFVDDSKINVNAAEAYGLKTIYYQDFNKIPDQLRNMT